MHECCDDLSRSVLAVIANGASYSYAFLEHDHRVPVTLALCYPILVVSVIDGPVFDALVIVAIDIEIAVEVLLPFHSLYSAVAAATVVGLEEVPVVVVFEEIGKHLFQLAVDDQRSLLAYEPAHVLQILLGVPQSFELQYSGLLDLEVLFSRSLV